ncbi:MAG: IS4 family transposase [Methanomicrobiales archaeon]|nr:IS4 family transposase [Methanomicrobiales archaeon]
MERFLPYNRICELALITGFCQRLRKIHPVIFLQVFLFTSCVHRHATIAEIHRVYQAHTKSDVTYSSFVGRLNKSSVRFFEAILDECIRSTASGLALELREKYARFITIFIQDSTIIRLNKKLADRFPATRTTRVAAGVKIGYLFNVLANSPRTVSVVPERTAEIKTLRVGPWVKGSLLLIDLGFYTYRLFVRIHENRGFFVSRVKKGSKLRIEAVHSPMKESLSKALIGQDFLSVIAGLEMQSFDATVSFQFKRRQYRGKQRTERYRFRCVGRIHPETGEWHCYLTNLNHDEFNVNEIADLYRFRWEIESLFDEAKNECSLGDIAVTREEATMTLLYIALIRQFVLKRVYLVLRTLLDEDARNRLAPKRYGKVFIEHMELLLQNLIDEWKMLKIEDLEDKGWGHWFWLLSTQSPQAYPRKLVRDTILKR